MNESRTLPKKPSCVPRRKLFHSTTALLVILLCLKVSSVTAQPRNFVPAKGLVIETLAPNSTLSRSGLRTGDVIIYWEPMIQEPETQRNRRQPDSAFDWFWFVDELLPRGPAKVTFVREAEFIDTIVFPGTVGARVRPVLSEEELLLYTSMAHLISQDSASEAIRLASDFFELQHRKSSDLLCWASFLSGEIRARAKDLPGAIEWYTRALALAHDPLVRIYIWQSIGIAHKGARQTLEAKRAIQEALAISQAFLPGTLIETTSLKGLYLLAWESRDLETVRKYALRENEILVRQAPWSLKLGDSWNILGVLASRAGDPDRAKIYHQQALALRRALEPESRDTARSLINLGSLELLSENYANARSLYLEALAALQKVGRESAERSTVYSNLGRVESALGNLAEAERMYRASLEHTQEDEVGRLSILRSLSYLAQKRGDFVQAEDWSQQVVETLKKEAPLSSEMGDALSSLASIRIQMGDLERAYDLFQSSLSIHQKLSRDDLDLAAGLSNIASVRQRAGDLAGAQSLWKKSLEILERRKPDGLSAARVLHNLGEVTRSLGGHGESLRLLRKALAIERRIAPSSPEIVTTLCELGTTLREMKRYEEALTAYSESTTIARGAVLSELLQSQTLHEKSIALRQAGRHREALESLREAVDLLEAQGEKIAGTDDNRTQFRGRFAKIYRDYIHILVSQGREKEAFRAQELFLARSLSLLFAERDLIFRDAPPELEASRVQLAEEYDLVQHRLENAQKIGERRAIDDLERELRDVRDRQNKIHLMLRQASPRLAYLRRPEPLEVHDAQETLDEGTLAVSFNVNTEGSLIFALMKDGTLRVHRVDVEVDELRREVALFMGLIRERPTSLRRDALNLRARRLYRLLLGPVDDLIERSRRILLIPDGPLHMLTFAALVRDSPAATEANTRGFLIERRPLHVASSLSTAQLLRAFQTQSTKDERERLVAFGDPAYPLLSGEPTSPDPYVRAVSGASPLAPLPWSRREIEGIADLFPSHATLFLGDEATEGAAKAALAENKYQYVHFAGHGYLDQKFPLNSAIALAIPKNFRLGDENGLLQAWEVLEQIRFHADLVVLSACESGLGQEMGGEGLVGLTRAFQYAGARSVMASLWKISDRTTAELMVHFYRHLKAGLSKDDALRAAQMELIQSPIQVTNESDERVDFDASAPYYWAAFQIYGDWQ